ncbi:MAG: Dabb family protein, partial [Bacteroidales bacterium]|nr:Dabb family protein [Bacteroidales bacterium]
MIKHIVMFKLPEAPKEVLEQFIQALDALPAQIPCLKSIEAGVNVSPSEEWDLALIATAETLEDVAVYSKHPAHVAAVQIIAPYKIARACVDYVEIQERSAKSVVLNSPLF